MGIKYSTSVFTIILFLVSIIAFFSCSKEENIVGGEITMPGLYSIDASELDDWDNGFIFCDESITEKSVYVLSKQINSEKVIYINYLNSDIIDGITFYITKNDTIGDIFYKDILYTVKYTDNTFTLYPHKDTEAPITISCTHSTSIALSRSNSAWWSGGDLVTKIIDIFRNGDKLCNGDFANLIIALSTDQLISMLKLGAKGNLLTWIGLELANRGAFAAIKEMYYHGSKPVLNEQRDGSKLIVTISPNNINDKDILLGLSIHENPKVIGGVIPVPTYTNYDTRTSFVNVGSSKDEYTFVYEFPYIGNYYIIPFLIPLEVIQEFQTEFVREWFVQYGDIQDYSYPTICVTNVEKKLCGKISDDKVAFRLGVNINIENPIVLSNYGLKIVNSEYEVANVSKPITSENNEVSLNIEGTLFLKDFDDLGKAQLYLSPYGENDGRSVFGKVYEYILSLSDLCPDGNHPHMIDLGLPSGKLWSCCNVGCNSPEKHGGYFAFGEIKEKTIYSWETYFDPNCSINFSISGNSTYDVATAVLGSGHRIPTIAEANELINNCSWELYVLDGINGVMGTGTNGNKIFLPSCGSKIDSKTEGYNECGEYWLADGLTSLITHPFYLYFNKEYITAETLNGYGRRSGKSVRAIHD